MCHVYAVAARCAGVHRSQNRLSESQAVSLQIAGYWHIGGAANT